MNLKNAARRIAFTLLASTLLIGAAGAQAPSSTNESAEPSEISRRVSSGRIELDLAAIFNHLIQKPSNSASAQVVTCEGVYNVGTGICVGKTTIVTTKEETKTKAS
jgi:hypothetical protein